MCMSCLSRRGFFKQGLLVFGAGVVGISAIQSVAHGQQNKHYRETKWKTYSIRREPNNPNNLRTIGFSNDEEKKLKEAMTIVAHRFHRPDVFDNALKNTKKIHFSGTDANMRGWKWNQYVDFIKLQWRGLWSKGFPTINVKPWLDKDYTGQAPRGEFVKVTEKTPKDGFSLVPFTDVTGEFEMEISLPFLNKLPAHQTAGTIAHEMLHNMGHDHPKGYTDQNFVTIFGDTLGLDGKFVAREEKKAFSLAGEEWPLPK